MNRQQRQTESPISRSTQSRWKTLLTPGLALKRWMFFLGLGVWIAAFGLALFLRRLHFPAEIPAFLYNLTLPFLPDWLRGSVLIGIGTIVTGIGVWQMNRQLAAVLLNRDQSLRSLELVDEFVVRQQQRQRRNGPNVVVIGGGTGMPSLLRALRPYTENITAVVTVADDGGSSGALRRSIGILPPGDFRNNIAALSDAEDLMTQLMQYRFGDSDGLGNHNFGNIFIAAMAAITGSFETGLAESSRVLAVQGRILPSTLDNVTLCAEIRRRSGSKTQLGANRDDGDEETWTDSGADDEEWLVVRGESRIPQSGGEIVRVFLEPGDCRAFPQTVRAILNADLILAAPGSFFTSLIPNLLVPRICEAILASKAVRLYVCNVTTQPGETDNFDVADHMNFLKIHAPGAFGAVLANSSFPTDRPDADSNWVQLPTKNQSLPFQLFTGDLINEQQPDRYDPVKLGRRIMEILEALQQDKTGPE